MPGGVVTGFVVGGGVVPPGGVDGDVTVKLCGEYVVISDGSPSVKQAATTRPGTAGAFVGTVSVPLHDPFAATGMFDDIDSDVDVILT